MASIEVYQDREIKFVSEGKIRTDNLVACFGIFAYLEKGGRGSLALGHHSSLEYQPVLEKWYRFGEQNKEFQVYDAGKIIVAKINSEPMGNNEWRQKDGRLLSYSERLEGLMCGLSCQYPNIEVLPVDYSFESELVGLLEDLTWRTNASFGSLVS